MEGDVWNKDKLIQNDAIHYYGYLPAVILHQDMTFKYVDTLTYTSAKGMQFNFLTLEDGRRHFKMWAGEAVMLSPFFLLGHAMASINGEMTHGYGPSYYWSIALGAWIYLGLGLLCIRAILRRLKFKDFIVALTILLLGLGTNLMYYASIEMAMSHVYSFFLMAFFLLLSLRLLEKPTVWRGIITGLVLGLIVLTRPTNFIVVVIPLFWGVHSMETFRERLGLLFKEWIVVLLAAVAFGCIVAIQPILWYWGTGEWLISSYGNEQFFWSDPQISKVLFSFRKGWFIYTPVLLLIIPGLLLKWRTYGGYQLPIFLFVLLNIYIISSWWCWWFGGSIGHRAFIDSYALLSIPLAIALSVLFQKWWMVLTGGAMGAVLVFNFRIHDRYQEGILHYDSMSEKAFWIMLQEEPPNADYWTNMDPPSYWNRSLGNTEEEPYRRALAHEVNVPKSAEEFPCLMLDTSLHDYFPGKELTNLIVDALVDCPDELQKENDVVLVLSIHNYSTEKDYLYRALPLADFSKNDEGLLQLYHIERIFYMNDPEARLKVYLWNPKGREVSVQQFGIGQEIQ